VNRSGSEGPIINDLRWLADSSGVAFLEGEGLVGDKRLVLVDLRKRNTELLTSEMEVVTAFDVRDRNHYVYTVADPAKHDRPGGERSAPAMVGTGRTLNELLFPDDPVVSRYLSPRSDYLWAVVDGKRIKVKHGRAPIISSGWNSRLALSPNGGSLVMRLPVSDIPASWEALYPLPYASSLHRLQAIGEPVVQYVRIDLRSGLIQSLTDAPTSDYADWWAYGGPSWSNNGEEILLPGTFLRSEDNKPSRPCVAVVDVSANTRTCVEVLKRHYENGNVEEGYHVVTEAEFVNGDNRRVRVYFRNHYDLSREAIEYHRTSEGSWQFVRQIELDREDGAHGLQVRVKQGFNEPALLVASDKEKSRVIWDPNPQLKNIGFGEAKVYVWNDNEGREWRAGLYMPRHYRRGERYPLVIQTHGFLESEFRPSGIFQTAFAARALAAAGLVVLQIPDAQICLTTTSREGPCAVSSYEAAVTKLVSEGIADPKRIGIVGFSRTCFYVMQTLTTGSLRLRAASITDGVMEDYWQYIFWPERFSNEANAMIGAPPFGEGLQLWLKRSPGFNLDKVTAPLLVVAEGRSSALFMWAPYAGLRYLHKPVDLIMLNTDEHVLTNPTVRLASQGGTVDWFRFWLQDYEDPDPAKAKQYARWRNLRKLQEESDGKLPAGKLGSN